MEHIHLTSYSKMRVDLAAQVHKLYIMRSFILLPMHVANLDLHIGTEQYCS